jgi:hypothetical protein
MAEEKGPWTSLIHCLRTIGKGKELRQKVEADFVFAKRGTEWSVFVGIFKGGCSDRSVIHDNDF